MRLIGTGVRWLFGVQAFVCLMVAISGAWRLTHHLQRMSGPATSLLIIFYTYFAITGLTTLIALLRIRRGERILPIVASILNLLIVPLGTLTGVLGLIYFAKKRDAPRGHVPVAGDGTSGLSQILWFVAQYAWLFLAFDPLRKMAVNRGLEWGRLDWTALAVSALAIYVAVLIHEGGHYIAGKSVHFHMFVFRVGIFDWREIGGHWKFRFVWAGLLGGGLTGMAPTQPADLRRRAMTMMLGGPIGSLLCGLTSFTVMLAVVGPNCPRLLGRFLVLLTAIALGDCILNLYPASATVGYSDGARLLQLLRRGPWAEFTCANYYMMMSKVGPLRPRDWPTDMVRTAAEFGSKLPNGQGSAALAYLHFEDLGDVEMADRYLRKAQDQAEPGSESARNFDAERAYFDAVHRGLPSAGLQWLNASKQDETADYWRTRAAVLALIGDVDGARASLAKGLALVDKLPSTGLCEFDRRQFRDTEALLAAVEASEPPPLPLERASWTVNSQTVHGFAPSTLLRSQKQRDWHHPATQHFPRRRPQTVNPRRDALAHRHRRRPLRPSTIPRRTQSGRSTHHL